MVALTRTRRRQDAHGVSLVRILLIVAYLAGIVVMIVYEANARRILIRAEDLESKERYVTAAVAYRCILETYPLSTSVVTARDGLYRTEPALLASRLGHDNAVTGWHRMLGPRLMPTRAEWLPLSSALLSAVACLWVFLSRFRYRRRVALVALLLAVMFAAWFVAQLAYYGVVSFKSWSEMIEPLMGAPVALYVLAWASLLAAAMMTLTSCRKDRVLTETNVVPVPAALKVATTSVAAPAVVGAPGSETQPAHVAGREDGPDASGESVAEVIAKFAELDRLLLEGEIDEPSHRLRRSALLASL